ncbi:cytochrome P450 (plasmid) [Embleya sp. NBC_00888]|uniref:cytochrome P450 n=1 Tax=Embleya sp. NBC_00888 TaxID=2975960 RepID=UPI002F9185CE|nr:cytochrome P450 [Embleya sp. NBC_00888]
MDASAIVAQLTAPDTRADPYPLYEQAQRLGPVLWVSDTFVVVTGHAEADRVLRDRDFGVLDRELTAAVFGGTEEPQSWGLLGRSILQSNPPVHTRLRKPIAAVFTARRIAALRPAVESAVDRLLAGMAEAGRDGAPVDFMDRFAFALPVGVICELLGVPEADRYRFRGPAHDLTEALEFMSGELDLSAADRAAHELAGYFEDLVAERRAAPREDLIGALVRLRDEDPEQAITDAELIANLVLLLVAGFETTTNLLGNGLALLDAHPGVRTALARRALPMASFVEEVLRHDSPVQLTSRIALTDGLTVGGRALPHHGEVLVLIGAANRDPARYHEPQRFDPWRAENGPLSFGAGIHYCVGAMLARLEAEVAFERLLARFPALTRAPGATRHDRLLLRGYGELPITLGDSPTGA